MSKKITRREGPVDQGLLTAVLVVLGAGLVLWLTGEVAGWLHAHTWPRRHWIRSHGLVTHFPVAWLHACSRGQLTRAQRSATHCPRWQLWPAGHRTRLQSFTHAPALQ